MLNIKWIGIIKDEDIKKYQKGELDKNAVKMEMPKSSKEQMVKALPFFNSSNNNNVFFYVY